MPPLLTRSEFNEQHVKDVCSCLLRRVIERIGCKRDADILRETPQLDHWRERGRLVRCGTTGACRPAHMESAFRR